MTATDPSSEPAQPPLTTVKPTVTRRRWWISVCLSIMIFLGGAITGAGLATMHIHHVLHDFLHHTDRIPDAVIPHLKRGLNLTDDQFRRVDQIIRAHHEKLDQVRRGAVSKVQEEFDSLDQEINEVLDDRQREEWRRRFHHVREMWFPLTNPPPTH